MTIRHWHTRNSMIAGALLAALIGSVATGCSGKAPGEVALAPHSPAAESNGGAIATVADTKTLATETATEVVGLRKDMPYAEARDLLLEQGWQPSSPDQPGNEANLSILAVRELYDFGYQEVKDCSGTGLGLCRLEFTRGDREVLAVSVTTANEEAEPYVWDWSTTGKATESAEPSGGSSTGSSASSSTANSDYSQQPFSETLFSQVRQLNQFCFGIAANCVYRDITFSDAHLVAEPYEYGATHVSLIFNQPVSVKSAIAYSKILDARGDVDFDSVDPQADRNVYYGCWEREAGGDEMVPMCTVTNVRTVDGTVSEVSIQYTTP